MPPELGHLDGLGFIIFAIVFGSLLCIVLAATLGKPWKPKVTFIVLGTLFALTICVVGGMWVGGHVFSLLVK